MKLDKRYLSDIPLLALIAANAVPVVGVLYFQWDAFYLVLLYWAENMVIGFYNVLKMACANVPHPIDRLSKLYLIPFFIVHYGGFCAFHSLLILTMFEKKPDGAMGSADWPCLLILVQMALDMLRQACSAIPPNMRYAIAALFVSHGISFVGNYLIKGEYRTTDVEKQMGDPYSRVVVLDIAILAGALSTMALGSPVLLLLALVVLKTIFDAKLHGRERKKKQKGAKQS